MNMTPAHFETRELSSLVSIEIGRTPSRSNPNYWGGTQCWATIADFNHGDIVTVTKEKITQQAVRNCGVRVHDAGTLIMSFKLTIGKLAFLGAPMATNEAIAALKPLRAGVIDERFLFHYLSQFSFDSLVDRAAKGHTLNKAKLSLIPITYPRDLKEQRRIATVLDKADDIRRKRRKAYSLVDLLLRSTFVDRFGDPALNEKQLPTAPIKKFGRVVTGNTPPRNNQEYYGPGIEWIKSDNINTPSHYLTTASETLSMKGKAIARLVPSGATLVTCIAGSPSCIGNAAIANREVAFNQQINAVIPNFGIDPFFLYCQFLVGKKLVQSASTNSMKGMVSKGKFEELEFLLPSVEEQQWFGRFFEQAMTSARKLQAAMFDSEQLFESLSQRAFRGEL